MGTKQPDGTEINIDQEAFQKTAEAFAASVQVPIDPIATKRTELHGNLLRAVQNAAQAKANLIAASSSSGGSTGFGHNVGFRNAEREAQNALWTLIEWEAGLL